MENLGVFDGLPRKLRECLPYDKTTVHLLSESILLAIRCIPDIIGPKEKKVDCNIVGDGPAIL
jgi:hypothetical protein